MPDHPPRVATTFSALADPTRAAVIQRLAFGAAPVSELARPFDMALPSFTQHLGVLEQAGLISSRREGRSRVCSLNVAALCEAEEWLATRRREWDSRLDRLEAHLQTARKDTPDD